MQHALRRYGLLLCAWILAALQPSAQRLVDEVPPEFEQDVDSWIVEEERRDSPYYKRRFEDVYAADFQEGRVYAVVSHMAARFDDEDWGVHEAEQAQILRQVYRFLTHMETALKAPGIEGAVDTEEEQIAFLESLDDQGSGLASLRMDLLLDAGGNDVTGYFDGTPDELLLYVWAEDGEQKVLTLPNELVRQWRIFENALSHLVSELSKLVRDRNVGDLEEAVVRWENYLDEGYSQMPWESLVNGWLIPPPELGPPDHQWILLHPSFGVEADVAPLDEAKVKASLQVELLGHVWYRGKELDDYFGLSATVSLREDLDPGLGMLFHLKRNWSLGVTWHDVDEDPFLFLSLDLFQFARENAPAYLDKYGEVREKLGLD